MLRLDPYFPKSHGKPPIDNCWVSSCIVPVSRSGLRWRNVPKDYGPAQGAVQPVKRCGENPRNAPALGREPSIVHPARNRYAVAIRVPTSRSTSTARLVEREVGLLLDRRVDCFFYGLVDLPQKSEGRANVEPARALEEMAFQEGLSNSKFIRLVIATFIIASVLFALVVRFVPIVMATGISGGRAAEAAAFIGAGSIAGRFLCVYLLNCVPATIVGSVAFFLPAPVSLLLFYFGADEQMIFGLAFALGFSLGSEIDVIRYTASRLIGLKNYGSLFGICVSAMALGVGVGP